MADSRMCQVDKLTILLLLSVFKLVTYYEIQTFFTFTGGSIAFLCSRVGYSRPCHYRQRKALASAIPGGSGVGQEPLALPSRRGIAPGPVDDRMLSDAPSPALCPLPFAPTHQTTGCHACLRLFMGCGAMQCHFKGLLGGTVVTRSTEGITSRHDLVGHQLHLLRHQLLMPSIPELLFPPTQPGEITQLR